MTSLWKIFHTCLRKHTETPVGFFGWKVIFPEWEITRARESICLSVGPTSTTFKIHPRSVRCRLQGPTSNFHSQSLWSGSPGGLHPQQSCAHSTAWGLGTGSAIYVILACDMSLLLELFKTCLLTYKMGQIAPNILWKLYETMQGKWSAGLAQRKTFDT